MRSCLILALLMAVPSVAFAGDLPWVIHDAGTRIVLADGTDVKVRGRPAVIQETRHERGEPPAPVVMRAAVATNRVPKPLRAWKGRAVELVGADGPVCTATVKGFAVLGRVVPSWYAQPASRAEAWEDTRESRSLVAELRDVRGDCAGAIWARARGATSPVASPRLVGVDVEAEVLAAARKTADYQAIERRYRASCAHDGGCAAAWHAHERVAVGGEVERGERELELLELGGRTFVTSYLHAGGWGTDVSGALYQLWELDAKTGWTLRYSAPQYAHRTLGMVDSDADGVPELLFARGRDLARLIVGASQPEVLHVADHGSH